MKIDRLRAFMSRDKNRPRVILAMDTDDGLTGWGECYNHGPDKALFALFDYLTTFIKGHDPRRVEFIVQMLLQQARFPPGALGLAAIAAIDHCLWDISAKALGVPVYQLLGGHVRERVQVYAGLYTAPDVPQAKDQMDALNAKWGITAFKLSPYRVDMHCHRWGEVVKTSADYFRGLREAVRSDYDIAFDAHAKIFEVGQAIQLGNALAPYDPLFFEEPIRPENFEAWRTETRFELHAGHRRVVLQPLRIFALAASARLRHHPARRVCGGWPFGDAQDRGDCRGAFRQHRAAQPDGPAGHRHQCAFLRGSKQLSHP